MPFIKSPIFDNWVKGKNITSSLLICAPYIKYKLLRNVIEYFDLEKKDVRITLITSGRPDVFYQKSSDIEAIRYFSTLKNGKLFFLSNLHMKAYCIDEKELLITSGNFTHSGMCPSGNAEGGVSTTDSAEIASFLDYCKEIIDHSASFDTSDAIIEFCAEIENNKDEFDHDFSAISVINKKIKQRSQVCVGSIDINSFIMIPQKSRSSSLTEGHSRRKLDDLRSHVVIDDHIDIFTSNIPESAYFLGAIFIDGARQFQFENKNYVAMGMIQNNQPENKKFSNNIILHRDNVLSIMMHAHPKIKYHIMSNFDNSYDIAPRVGTAVYFPNYSVSSETIMNKIMDVISESDYAVKVGFITGVFDSKGYIDKQRAQFGVDLEDNPEYINFFLSTLESIGIKHGPVNPPRERENTNNKPRKNQLRVSLDEYCKVCGIISPNKFTEVKPLLKRTNPPMALMEIFPNAYGELTDD